VVEDVAKDRIRRWSRRWERTGQKMVEMWLKTGQEDGRGGRKGQVRRLKMWVKTGQEDGRGGGKGQD
jgi:hypothetical protein